jgi:iron complex outermembrane receptor protein
MGEYAMKSNSRVDRMRIVTSATAISMVVATAAGAQQAQSGAAPPPAEAGLEEIVVTAQQRSESLQRAAISVDTVTANTLIDAGVTEVSDLTHVVPALTVSTFNGPYFNYAIRGITNFTTSEVADNSIVINENGVPLARPSGGHGLFFDLDRVEVLKGPQGTLYGRNATGGVINVIPKAPGDDYDANVYADFGNYHEAAIGGAVDIPLSSTVTTRTAFQSTNHSGYYQDGTGDEANIEGRFTLNYKPNDAIKLAVVFDGSHDGGKGPGSSLLNARASGLTGYVVGPWAGEFNQDPKQSAAYVASGFGNTARNPADAYQNNTYWGLTNTLNWALPIGDLTAIVAHRETDLNYMGAVAASYYGEFGEAHQESAEVRLASNNSGPLQYLVGAFWLKDAGGIKQYSEQNLNLSASDVLFTNNTYAGFGQLTYAVIDTFRVVAAARVNQDRKENDSPRYTIPNFPYTTQQITGHVPYTAAEYVGDIDKSDTFNSVTWKGGVEYDVTPTSLAYANIGTGFKAGGFGFGPPGGAEYQPEKVLAYTLGSKNRFADNKLQMNAELYYMKYRDQQISYLAALPSIGNFTVTQNIGSSTLYGLDFDSIYLVTQTTRLNLNLQLEKTKYDSLSYVSPSNPSGNQTCPVAVLTTGYAVTCGGKPLVNAPRATVQAGIEQTVPLPNGGSLLGALDSRYESARETQLNYLPETHVGSYHKTDLTITYHEPKDRWHVQAYVDNAENAAVPGIVLVGRNYNITTGGLMAASLEPPRTFGVRFGAKF